MCLDVPRSGGLRTALALTLMLALAGPARAQSPGWVDPPARGAGKETAKDASEGAPARETPAAAPPAAVAGPAPAPAASPPAAAHIPAAHIPAAPAAEQDAAAEPRRRAGRHRARRLADTPAAAPPEGPADPRFSEWAGRAQDLTGDYLAAFSGPNDAMIAGAPRFYAERLRFHGRATTLAALLLEKRRFARRWPERRYAPHDTRTACNAALRRCIVHTRVAFRAASPARGARAQGEAELVLEVSFSGARPVIVSETSRVLRRGGDG